MQQRRIEVVRRRVDAYRRAFTQMTPGFNDYKELLLRANLELRKLAQVANATQCNEMRSALIPFRSLIARANALHASHGGRRVRVISITPAPEPSEQGQAFSFLAQSTGQSMGDASDDASEWLIQAPSGGSQSSSQTGASTRTQRTVDRMDARIDRYASKRRKKLAKRNDPLSRFLVRAGDRLKARIGRMKKRRAARRKRRAHRWAGW